MGKIDYVLGFIEGAVEIITEGKGFEPEHHVTYRVNEDFVTIKKVHYYIPAQRTFDEAPKDDEPVYNTETIRLDSKNWKKEVIKELEDIYNSDLPDYEVPEFED